MALSGQYISIYEIIERVYMDNGYEDVPLHDCVVWAGQSLDRIGAITAYEKAPIELIDIKYSRGKFPCDLHKINQMRVFPSLIPLIESRSKFSGRRSYNFSDDELNTSNKITISLNTYERNGDYFYTHFEEGQVELSYTRFPTDKNGFPMIPKDTKYSDAVAAYIQMKMDFRAFRKKEISGEIYMISKRDWAFKAGQAKQKALLYDTVDQMESFKNQFLRLVPDINFHSSGFANSTLRETRVNNPTGVHNSSYLR